MKINNKFFSVLFWWKYLEINEKIIFYFFPALRKVQFKQFFKISKINLLRIARKLA